MYYNGVMLRLASIGPIHKHMCLAPRSTRLERSHGVHFGTGAANLGVGYVCRRCHLYRDSADIYALRVAAIKSLSP